MEQWHSCKQMARDALLLFRLGDFYEAFYEDAALIARELSLTLTQRQGIPMAGVPFHASDAYIDKLVAKGYRVALAEQMSDPKKTKGLVKREVSRVVTPGALVTSNLLCDNKNNYFASVMQVGQRFGLAFVDLTTSEFRVTELDQLHALRAECFRFQPAEVLTSERFYAQNATFFNDLKLSYPVLITTTDDWRFDHQVACSYLMNHFQVHSLDGFGLRGAVAAINAAGALLQHLREILSQPVDHLNRLQPYTTANYMAIDAHSQCNLELTRSLHDGSRKTTLLEVLDETVTPMGGRLIARWIKQPLLDVAEIRQRQDAVGELMSNLTVASALKQHLDGIRDLERLNMKVQSGYALPRDLVALRHSLMRLPHIKEALRQISSSLIREHEALIQTVPEVVELLARAITDEPPLRVGEGTLFRSGYHLGIDELRSLNQDSQSWMAQYQHQLREATGIKTLKVGYTRPTGYFIEISRGQVDRVPDTFERRQMLANAERFTTRELKGYETKVLTAEDQLSTLETQLFGELLRQLAVSAAAIAQTASALAVIDCIQSLAQVAHRQGYTKPVVDESDQLVIESGRHPVIENLHLGEKFIPNDTHLNDTERLLIITGPNMAGKSTFLRQVALVVIMAQIGSFVPAAKAHVGKIDQVFTRIGASDDLSRGHSTFMVEMTETANILHNATSRSLVILDEIGRGTSTYDGISIAWAVAEYLLTTPEKRAKTLFATHYWELTELEGRVPGAVNYNIAVRECDDRVLFLRKIVRGRADKSYGIHVGALAGLPQPVLMRARQVLTQLEESASRRGKSEAIVLRHLPAARAHPQSQEVQLLLFEPPRPAEKALAEALAQLDVDNMTPVQALAKLVELKGKIAPRTPKHLT